MIVEIGRQLPSLMYAEWLKIKGSNSLPLIFVSPLLAALAGYFSMFDFGTNQWIDPYFAMVMIHAVLFLPLLAGIFTASVCRYEHDQGGWKQIMSMPVRREAIYLTKFITVLLIIAATQLLFFVGLLGVGSIHGFTDPFPWSLILTRVFMGWLACIPLVTLQLWFSTAWASFAAPVALNVIFTLPNIMVANSEKFGPWYPWAQPFLGMILGGEGDIFYSTETLIIVIVGGSILLLCGGLLYIRNKSW
ncbi:MULTISPECIES: ABC transporter permease [Bacillaceae]|uniref:ABC transporter permease n=1 Tax=Evansella alkalicola TaxID=745819 RepID=A0ABS6JSX5_9BACI|nr:MULTISPECIES: ABC transporter permease [Bacillaceae]MBU9721676.1 ABC transporter permease [Bacillus alkalicola]